MKKVILLLTILTLYQTSFSQPVISYMLPDIGAPGMNTYFEIIGIHNRSGNFGSDGFYLNNEDSEVRIALVNPSDSAKISFGPLTVSWGGRMISSQAFVHPNVQPNSENWQALDPQFKIPIRVQRGVSLSNIDTFYIVRPTRIGDARSISDRVFGNGTTLGKRSRRGAMIVDSLFLPDATYTVSTADTDPATDGNQGYLPFILLSKGPILGSANTVFSVASTDRHAGPGGGGGGGSFFDFVWPHPGIGDDGGNGFTGGGPGGKNDNVGSGNAYKNTGIGTGANGNSLNDVAPGVAEWYEAAGGGTGHPFGRSGYGCNGGYTCVPDGGYGGGSGAQQDLDGAGGGNASNGENSGPNNGGKAHGNIYIVPFHGGSGGSSGNPNKVNSRSGNGGGGGGAISVFAPTIKNLTLVAKGGDGQNSTYDNKARGGGGSGGCASLQAKNEVEKVEMQVHGGGGGKKGGAGRARYDIPLPEQKTQINISNSEVVNYYQGLSSDTNYFVKRDFQLRITARPGFYKLRTFIKPLGDQWYEGNEGIDGDGDGSVLVDVSLPAPHDIFYFVVVEEIQNPLNAQYNIEPRYVMSQAAANIFKIDLKPIICGDSASAVDTIIACPGRTVLDSFRICNKGNHNLLLELSTAEFKNQVPGFSFVGPKEDTDVPAGDTTWVYVRYDYSPGFTGLQTDTLVIHHNDSLSGREPWKYAFSVYIKKVDFEFLDIYLNKIDTLFLGTYCAGKLIDTVFVIRNLSEIDINVLFNRDAISYVRPRSPEIGTQPGKDTVHIRFSHIGSMNDQQFYTIIVLSQECEYIFDTLVIKIDIIETKIEFSNDDMFYPLMLGETETIDVFLKNTGKTPAYIEKIPPLTSPFQIVNISPSLPYLLMPDEKITISVSFTPLESGNFVDTLFAESLEINGSCYAFAKFILRGMASGNKLRTSTDTLDFGVLPYCKTGIDTVAIYNISYADITINSISISKPGIYEILEPYPSTLLKAKDSTHVIIRFTPPVGSNGSVVADLIIKTNESGDDSLLKVVLIGVSEQPDIISEPEVIQIGSHPIPSSVSSQFDIINYGYFDYTVATITTSSPNAVVNPSSNITIPSEGGRRSFDVNVDITSEGPFEIFIYIEFNDPCLYRDTIIIRGNGLTGEVAYADNVDFGVLPWCKDSRKPIFFKNTGDASVYFLRVEPIYGIDRYEFYYDQASILPAGYEMVSGESHNIYVIFDPKNASNDGIKNAYATTVFLVNGIEEKFVTELKGERRSGIFVAPDQIDFGRIVRGTSIDKTLKIKNNGRTSITLYEILPFGFPSIFSVDPPNISRKLALGDSIEFTLSFLAEDAIKYQDRLIIKILVDDVDCGGQIIVELNAEGTPLKKVRVWMPVVTVSPDIDEYRLALYAGLETDADLIRNMSLTATIRFNSSMYYPLSVSRGSLTRAFEGDETIAIVELDSIDINGTSTILTEFIGPTALADRKTTPLICTNGIHWKVLNIVDTENVDYKDGRMTIEICEEGGDRLLEFSYPAEMKISPNPVTDRLNIDIRVLETGKHHLEIVNVAGQRYPLVQWDVPVNSNKEYQFNININSFSSGMYYLILRSPARIKALPMMIVK